MTTEEAEGRATEAVGMVAVVTEARVELAGAVKGAAPSRLRPAQPGTSPSI